MRASVFDCLLLDLDGTLIDTAPDMTAALVSVCRSENVVPPPFEHMRSAVSNGSVGLLRLAFNAIDENDLERLVPRFLAEYEARLALRSSVFDGMSTVLDAMEQAEKPWGIVTNKPERLSRLLMQALRLERRSGCIIGGDSLVARKPDPAPLLHAARLIGVDPGRCVYVGDNNRDMIAGRSAGMGTVAARWGYIVADDDIGSWQADRIIDHPRELMPIMGLRPAQAS